jgi:competence protein ComEA
VTRIFSSSRILIYLEVISGLSGLLFLVYGFYVLLVERSNVQLCSLEMLSNQNEILVAQQPKIVVEVMGAVKQVGVWQFNRGDRVGDALEKAGGVINDADKEFVAKNLNLASKLSDGDKIYIPFNWEVNEDEVKANSYLISINNASKEELMSISGIGESRANLIIENRPYFEIKELVDKKVISESLFNNIGELLSI